MINIKQGYSNGTIIPTIKLMSLLYCGVQPLKTIVDECQQACLIHINVVTFDHLVSEFPLNKISCFTLQSENRGIFRHSADPNKHLLYQCYVPCPQIGLQWWWVGICTVKNGSYNGRSVNKSTRAYISKSWQLFIPPMVSILQKGAKECNYLLA